MNDDNDEYSTTRSHRQEKKPAKKFDWHSRRIDPLDRFKFLVRLCQSDHTLAAVGSVLVDWYNCDWGYACPTIEDLMTKTGASKTTVYRVLDLLHQKEWFEIYHPRERNRIYARPCLKRTLREKKAEKYFNDVVVKLRNSDD